MQSSVVGGLFACGLDTPFTTIYERQERCTAAAEATGCAIIPMLSFSEPAWQALVTPVPALLATASP